MEINSIDFEKLNEIIDRTYSKEYGVFLLITLITFGSILFTGFLFI